LSGEIRLPDNASVIQREPRGEIATVERGAFAGFKPGPVERTIAAEQKLQRGMFAGLKLNVTPAPSTPTKAPARNQDRDYARAVERASRSAEAVLQARASGAPILEH
jgi:hypothetical protein